MDKDQLEAERYSLLGQIWAHHNLEQLQWPVVIVGAIIVGLGTLATSKIEVVEHISYWRSTLDGKILGLPFLLAGIITTLVTRPMARAREIMRNVERELDKIDAAFDIPPESRFSRLNHPTGASGVRPLAIMMLMLAIFASAVGCCLLAGWVTGVLVSIPILCLLLWISRPMSFVKAYRRDSSQEDEKAIAAGTQAGP